MASPLALQAGFLLLLSGGEKAVHNSTHTRRPVALTFCHQCQCGQSLTIILIVEEKTDASLFCCCPPAASGSVIPRLQKCTFQVSRLQSALYLQACIPILDLNKFIGNWKHSQLITARVKCKQPKESHPVCNADEETAATCRGAASAVWFAAHAVFSRQPSQGATVLFIPWQTLPFSLFRLGTQQSLGELAVYCYQKPRGFGYPALLGSFATLNFKQFFSISWHCLLEEKKSHQPKRKSICKKIEIRQMSFPCPAICAETSQVAKG